LENEFEQDCLSSILPPPANRSAAITSYFFQKSVFATSELAISCQIVKSGPLAAPNVGLDVGSKDQRCAEASIDVSRAECLLQRCKRRFACTVAGGNILDLEFVLERGHDLLNGIIGGRNKVEASGNEMDFGIDRCCGLYNAFDSRMRTADDKESGHPEVSLFLFQ
jgi:hypothetical protein